MTYGVRIQANAQGATFDTSRQTAGFALVDIFLVGANDSFSKSYPEMAGFTLHANDVALAGDSSGIIPLNIHSVSIDYAQGFPRVTCVPVGTDRASAMFYVFAT